VEFRWATENTQTIQQFPSFLSLKAASVHKRELEREERGSVVRVNSRDVTYICFDGQEKEMKTRRITVLLKTHSGTDSSGRRKRACYMTRSLIFGSFPRLVSKVNRDRDKCEDYRFLGPPHSMTLPFLHRPPASGPIQWARGDVGLKPCAAPRPWTLADCKLCVAASGLKPLRLPHAPVVPG